MGGWFLFFSFVEKYLGEYDLAISNLVRTVYMLLLIPSWGFSSGINTMVSHFIGRRKRMAVLPIIQKTALINLISTMVIAIPVLVFPSVFLYPLFWGEGMSMVNDTKPAFLVLLFILCLYSVTIVYFNGLVGAWAMIKGLWIQFVGNVFYIGSVFVLLRYFNGNVETAWAAELLLWAIIFAMTVYYLKSKRWHFLRL
jgi:Na+-driven multidrug efflux pump